MLEWDYHDMHLLWDLLYSTSGICCILHFLREAHWTPHDLNPGPLTNLIGILQADQSISTVLIGG